MARQGIYVNGKEIVARYVGDKKVWEKKQWINILTTGRYRFDSEWNRTAYCWCYISKEGAQEYPAQEPQNGLKVIFHSPKFPEPISIENVTGAFYYTTLATTENNMDKTFWNKCHLQFEFQNMQDLATFKRLTYDTTVLLIEVLKKG